MATEYQIADKIEHSTAEQLRHNPDAVIAWGEEYAYVLEVDDGE